MDDPTSQHCDVLIVGAGPTGLVLALCLTRLGVKVRIVDKTDRPGTTSRALAVQARTLELYRALDLDREIVARGHATRAGNFWVHGQRAARIALDSAGRDITPYPFMFIFPQDEHEQLLIARLADHGVVVERHTELSETSQGVDGIEAILRGPQGTQERCGAAYVAGCDGASSTVRHALGIAFSGGTYRQLFYVADVDAAGPPIDGELHIDLDEADFLAVFPLAAEGRVRLIGTVRDDRADASHTLCFDDVRARAIEHLKIDVRRVNWFSTYRVHHRVASRFRDGRAFLLGDAAHIHSPAGGQGMNTGIGDAINLAWKIAAVLKGQATEALLDSFEAERIGFARRLVRTTDRVFTLATKEGRIADAIRLRAVPLLLPRLAKLASARDFIFRTLSQTSLHYRHSPLSSGRVGDIRGGERMPWVAGQGDDDFARAHGQSWQVHVYGPADEPLRAWCAKRGVPLRQIDWRAECAAAGLRQHALYLVRPDGYVALAADSAVIGRLDDYEARHGLAIRRWAGNGEPAVG